MKVASGRVMNLTHLLDLAGTYRGFSRKQLAEALGRDPTKLFSATANPKLDYIVRLADVLDWHVGDVAEAIWDGTEDAQAHAAPHGDFESLNAESKAAHSRGDYVRMFELSQQMLAVASTPEQRALACLREGGAWDGQGRYTKQLDAVRKGLEESPISTDIRVLLQVNLANAYYTLGQLLEARAMSRDLIDQCTAEPPTTRASRAAHAFACYVLGQASRCLIAQQPDRAKLFAAHAKEALADSVRLYTQLVQDFNHEPWRGIINTCQGGILVAEVALGERPPQAIINHFLDGLNDVIAPAGDRLESYGWWCIFGCEVALRHLNGAELQRSMAVFTNKGYEIADKLNNWAMRERLFAMEFIQRQRLNELAGFPVEWTIDSEEVRVIVGAMGRFPSFRSTGWKILETATVIRDDADGGKIS